MKKTLQFGQVIKNAREDLGIRQIDLAQRIRLEDGRSMSPTYLHDIENNRRVPTSPSLILQFSEILRIPSDVLFYIVGELPPDIKGASDDFHHIQKAYKAMRKTLIEAV